jgi:hypothetical membrane protein
MSVETWISAWRASFAISFFGAIQFVICMIAAMLIYPGGNIQKPRESGFRVLKNYVSDLGRTTSISGKPNPVASTIFRFSVILFAVCLLPHFVFVPMQAWDKPGLLIAVSAISSISVIGLIVAALHPVNLYPERHHLGLFVWVLLMFFATGIHAMALLTSKDNVWLAMPLISVVVSTLAIGYCITSAETVAASLNFLKDVPLKSALLEKLMFLASLAWLFAFSLRMLLYTDFSEYRQKDVERDAEIYLSQIGMRKR